MTSPRKPKKRLRKRRGIKAEEIANLDITVQLAAAVRFSNRVIGFGAVTALDTIAQRAAASRACSLLISEKAAIPRGL
ncbi:MAG TPA: hypothetical protein VEM35_05010 [Rhizomicrobium sp.]|nr:hypothetical protein [Rhizomicrobium sp.]